MSSPDRTIPFLPTRVFERRMKLNHVVPGVALLALGLEALSGSGDEHVASAWLNIVVGAALVITVVREVKGKSPAGHSVIGWVDILAGCVIIVEGVNHFHPHKYFQPAYLYWLTGLLTILMGVFHKKISGVRRITFGDKALSIRRLFFSTSIPWNAIASVRVEPRAFVVRTKDVAERRCSLRNVENIDQVREALRIEATERGVGFSEKGVESGHMPADSVGEHA